MTIQDYFILIIPSYLFHIISMIAIGSKKGQRPRFIPHVVLAVLPLIWLLLIPIMAYQRSKKHSSNIAEKLLIKLL